MTYYDKFDELITEMSQEDASDDFFYDVGVFEVTNILNHFNEDDWKKLEKNIITKDTEWKKKAIYCFEGEHPEELPILLSIIDTDDFELFEICVDTLRFMITDDNRQRILCNNELLIKMKKEADRGISGKIFLDCITKLNQDFN